MFFSPFAGGLEVVVVVVVVIMVTVAQWSRSGPWSPSEVSRFISSHFFSTTLASAITPPAPGLEARVSGPTFL